MSWRQQCPVGLVLEQLLDRNGCIPDGMYDEDDDVVVGVVVAV